jgi:hypothetical protein
MSVFLLCGCGRSDCYKQVALPVAWATALRKDDRQVLLVRGCYSYRPSKARVLHQNTRLGWRIYRRPGRNPSAVERRREGRRKFHQPILSGFQTDSEGGVRVVKCYDEGRVRRVFPLLF